MRLTISNLLLSALALILFSSIIHLGRKAWSLRLASVEIQKHPRGSSLNLTPSQRPGAEDSTEPVGGLLAQASQWTERSGNPVALPSSTGAAEIPQESPKVADLPNTITDASSIMDPTAEVVEQDIAPVVFASPKGQDGTNEDLVPLSTEIPKAMFEGTVRKIALANLEPVEKKQQPLLVPRGLRNLALDKVVTSSKSLPVIGDLEYITDGNKDAADGSYVEIGPRKQWVQIDLGQSARLYGVWLWHFHKQARAYIDVIVQVSNDQNFADGVITIYNADHDNTAGLGRGNDTAYVDTNRGRVVNARGVEARYVRLHSNGNTANEMNHYIEVEVWGKESTDQR